MLAMEEVPAAPMAVTPDQCSSKKELAARRDVVTVPSLDRVRRSRVREFIDNFSREKELGKCEALKTRDFLKDLDETKIVHRVEADDSWNQEDGHNNKNKTTIFYDHSQAQP